MTHFTERATSATTSADSLPWSCAALTPERWTRSTTRLGWSSRNTPTVRISGGSRRVMSKACCTAIWRGDGANTNPTASAPIATAKRASSSLVIPQIFTNMAPVTVPPRPTPGQAPFSSRASEGFVASEGSVRVAPASNPRMGYGRRARTAAAGSAAVTRVSPTRMAS